MNKYLDQFRDSLIVRTAAIYAIAAGVLIWFPSSVAQLFDMDGRKAFLVAKLVAISNLPVAVYTAWIIDPVSSPDRRIFLLRVLWVWAPGFLGVNSLLLFDSIEGVPGESHFPIFVAFGLLLIVSYFWWMISNPFARAWAVNAAKNPDAIFRAETRFTFGPFTKHVDAHDEDAYDIEIRIAPKLYFSFVAALAALVFIVLETLIGEFVDNLFGGGGYIAASTIAIGVAVLMYPVHKRASIYVDFQKHVDRYSGNAVDGSLLNEVQRAFKAHGAQLKENWLIIVLDLVVVLLVIWWYVRVALDYM